MHRVLLVGLLFISVPLFSAQNCEVDCIAPGCSGISLEFEADCHCGVLTYTATYYYDDKPDVVIDDVSNPEFIGMDVQNLGCTCEPCV